ncbi:MAG: hypothetical protein JXB29_09155 [Sedimentisphaerales bacterium]|nr:hypothetical protein [Sedimentisphaerales bacterium]
MGPLLKGLVELQKVENELRAARAKLVSCRRNVLFKENQLKALKNTYQAKKEEIQLTRLQSDRLELELKTRDETISKLRASLNAARTNKEYSAVLTQLNTTKADNSKVETQILELLKGIEDDEAESKMIQGQINQKEQLLIRIREQAEVNAGKCEVDIEQIRFRWEKIAQKIQPEPLAIFKRVADTYDGEAIAMVVKNPGRTESYTCGGCFMGIPTETVNLLLTKDDIIRCPNCTRILVFDEQIQG